MNWKTKAALQRTFARLPFGSEAAYYLLQRKFGNLRTPESALPMFRSGAAVIFAELRDCGVPVEGARVLEVGTGHRIHMPLAFYLAGARSVITVDLYPILKRDLVMAAVADLIRHAADVPAIFQSIAEPEAVSRRLRKLAAARTFEDLCGIMGLRYLSPADATATALPSRSVDIHFSYTVFEHVPRPVLVGILNEGSRLIAKNGLICHHIDLSDHFSHADASIGKINFLQYSSTQWRKIDNDRFGYQNRLRADDYAAVYKEARQEILKWEEIKDPDAMKSLQNGFPLAPEYRGIEPARLCTVCVRIVSRPQSGHSYETLHARS